MDRLECPMCAFTVAPHDDYFLILHVEQIHTSDSPFIIKDDPEPLLPPLPPRPSPNRGHSEDTLSSDDEEGTVECPNSDCGEVVPLSEFNDHLDYHAAESLSFDETTGKYHSHHSSATMQGPVTARHPLAGRSKNASRNHSFSTHLPEATKKIDREDHHGRKTTKHARRARRGSNSSEKSTISRSILGFNPFAKPDKTVRPPVKSARLGKSELGPYAWEERMPRWLHDQLAAGANISTVNRIGRDGRLIKHEQVQNETPGIIPILAQLSALDRSVKEAYYCHPSTLHVGKTPKEGSFCGYRNIQMVLSYIQGAKAQGYEEFPGRLPTILKMQDIIEDAWDNGINEIGRVQTGGIRNTRKYIGTPEAQAFFLNTQIDCAVEQFSDKKDRGTMAHELLLAAMERYFRRAAVSDGSKVYKTLLPPIYLQQPGHSLTIVGFERRYDGTCNLVVFDPMYSTSPAMHKLVGRKNIRTARPEVMYAYRRSAEKLKHHAAYEILMLTATPPLFPAWDVLRQFPDCRFVYAFFRTRTLGYDVYPEDYFLRNFPWQQYGGLWSCDDARFARAEPMNALIAQALRRITSEGSSTGSSNGTSPTSPTSFLTNSFSQHMPAVDSHLHGEPHDSIPSWVGSLDGSTTGFVSQAQSIGSAPVFNMGSLAAALPQPKAMRPQLSLLTDVGRKYPGFPTPLSPTPSAKELYPSPASQSGSRAATPRALSPAMRPASPMSIDGSEMCGPSHRCESHGYNHYASQMGLIDNVLSGLQTHTPSASSRSVKNPTSPPVSPSRCVSPRTAMLKKMAGKQDPSPNPGPVLQFSPHTRNINAYPASPPSSVRSFSTASHSHPHPPPPPPSINIANGVESEATSPIDPSGTMLFYTSNRSVDSGLLGVRPLSESQVAEYRFWRPCGRRICAFGCGGAHIGEAAAAKRLFKDVDEVRPQKEDVVAGCEAEKGAGCEFGCDGQCEDLDDGDFGRGVERQSTSTSTWAGRRLVTDWNRFLTGCEREGVAPF